MSRIDSPLADRVIFAVGARRSGTNWLRRVLDAHPEITVIPAETYLFSHGLRPLADRIQHGLSGSARTGFVYMDREAFFDGARDFCDKVFLGAVEALGGGAGRIADRTPDHVRHLDLIGAVYPDAWVVHIIRDGRDVARSLASQQWGPVSIEEAAREWCTAVVAGRQEGAGLARYREVRYEALLSDTGHEVEELYRWLGVECGERVVADALREADVPYNVDPSFPLVGAGKWRREWSERDLSAFEREAGDLLIELGYEKDAVEPSRSRPPLHRGLGATLAGGRRRAMSALAAAGDAWRHPRGVEARSTQRRLAEIMTAVHDLMEEVAARRWDEIPRHLHDDAMLRVTSPSGEWSGRGPEKVQRFLDELRSDPALAGRQRRSSVHPGVPSFTFAAVYETPTGDLVTRTWVVGVRRGSISELSLHRS